MGIEKIFFTLWHRFVVFLDIYFPAANPEAPAEDMEA